MQIGGAGGTGGGGGGCIVVLTANFCAAFVDVVAKGQLFHDLMTDATDAFITDATDALQRPLPHRDPFTPCEL